MIMRYFFPVGMTLFASSLFAVSAGINSGSLDTALFQVNLIGGTIEFNIGDVFLTSQVRAVQSNAGFIFVPGITIEIEGTVSGNRRALDGQGTTRGFFVGASGANGMGSVTIRELDFIECRAKGGDGNLKAGGGLGAGGGLFVGRDTNVNLIDCAFLNCSAKGGDGGGTPEALVGSGGGGMRGNGGFVGGGGGFGGNGASNGPEIDFIGGGGGANGFPPGNANMDVPGKNFNGLGSSGDPGVGGEGNTAIGNADSGGFGGGGGGAVAGAGGNGGYGGGGGGSQFGNGGNGDFGGGGGSAGALGNGIPFNGGNGGFGAGGGSESNGGIDGIGGFGGGDASGGLGGRGAGFGGAIFVEPRGNLSIEISSNFTETLFSGNSAAAGDFGNASTDPNANGGSLGQDIFLMSEGQITFNLETPVSMPSAIQGNIGSEGEDQTMGGIIKSGSALLALTGENTYTGKTTVMGGELRINSSLISEIEVLSGTTLSGSFTAKNVGTNPNAAKLTNGGTIPLEGDITLENEYIQTGTGGIIYNISPLANRGILTATAATLDGTLEVIINAGNYIAGTTFLIIDAPVTGEFSTIVRTGTVGNQLPIEINYSSAILTILSNHIFEEQVIDPGVPLAVATCIKAQDIVPGSDFAMVVEDLGLLSNAELNKALLDMSAVNYAVMDWINTRNNSYVANLLAQHIFELCCSKRDCQCYSTSAWVNLYGTGAHQRQVDNLDPFETESYGGMIGIDRCFGCNSYLGIAGGYTYTFLDWRKKNLGHGEAESFYGAFYGGWQWDSIQFDTAFIGGRTGHDFNRKISFPGLSRVAKSHPSMSFFTFHLGAQGKFYWSGCCFLEPYGVFDYHYLRQKRFTEHGTQSISLSVKNKTQDMVRLEAGARGYWEYNCDNFCYAPYLGLGVLIDFPLLGCSEQKASFRGDEDCVMVTRSYKNAIRMISPQVGIKWTHCAGLSLIFGYKGLLGDKATVHQGEGRVEYVF